MENNVEKIMKDYKKEVEKIDKKYEVKEVKVPKKIDTKELDEKIKYEKEFIEKLKYESEDNNKDLIEKAKARLESFELDKKEIEEKNQKEYERYEKAVARRETKILANNKLKNSIVRLDSGREVTMTEKDKLDRASLKDKAIMELTQEGKSISEQLLNKKQKLEEKRKEWQEFKYEFDDEHKITNGNVVEKIHADYDKLVEEMKELSKMQEECDKYLTELKMPTKEDKSFSDAWNSAYKEETKSGPANSELANSEPTNSGPINPGQTNPGQTNPGQTNSRPANPGPANSEPTKSGPANSEPTKSGPANSEPTNSGPTNPRPANPRQINSGLAFYNPKELSGINPQIRIDAKTGKLYYNDGIKENEPVNIGYPKKYWKDKHILSALENIANKFDIKINSLAKDCDPNIINVLEKNPEMLEQYVLAIYNDEPFPFEVSYNLEGMYNVDFLTNREKAYLNRTARKAEKQGAEVKRDSLLDRAKGWIKSHISKSTRNKAVEEKKKQMLNEGLSEEAKKIMEFDGNREEFINFCTELKENNCNMNELKSVIYKKLSQYKTEESNTENFKGALKVEGGNLSKVHHYTSKKLNKSKLLNNVKMNAKIATTRISGFFKGENPLKTYSKVQNIKNNYMSR